jgi:hypothetical protein
MYTLRVPKELLVLISFAGVQVEKAEGILL